MVFLFKNWRLPAPYCKPENCGCQGGFYSEEDEEDSQHQTM
jgi:hypothetical protein